MIFHRRFLVGALTSSALLSACSSSTNSFDSDTPFTAGTGGLGQGGSSETPDTPAAGTTGDMPSAGGTESSGGAAGGSGQTPDPEGTPVAINGQLRVEGGQLVNASGQPVQLKGISSMWLNWEGRYSQNKEGLQWLRDNWGITVYRAALGIEPQNAYLDNPAGMLTLLRTAVRNAEELGLYVIIDWHDHNAHDHQAEAVSFFSEIAAEFGHLPNVLYETYNEPEGQTDWSSVIKPYHEAVIPAIRAQDPDGIVILGNRQWDQRPDEAAADPVAGDNLMYTVHFYACDHQQQQRADAQRALDAGLALFVTEWGATPADGGAQQRIVCEQPAQDWHDWMNQNSISWAAWKFDGCSDSSCFFPSRSAPVNGGWTDEWLNEHGRFVRARLLD